MDALKELFIAVFAALGVFAGVVALIFGIGVLCAIPVYLIINYLFSATFLTLVIGSAKITFWQSYWLTVLSGFLFKSSGSSSKKD